MKQPTKAHAAFRRMLALQNVRAAYLQARGRQITAKIDAIKAERLKAA